ncbi:glycosyltransferase family 4 protein [Candidatus Peregrinibacteria bacterium CG10_big_fil_rev_8_21_14_0_10_42_8]|nr:MAG: glycosyltransferase family 4 protein [Candidatus Peregrinibacteria bacterium CG10_big_fil_rev_8_21_14_0_10_42_8]
MKIALVHELLTMRGGAERVLKVLADRYPKAPIYTLLYDEKKLSDWFPRDRVIIAKPPFFHSLLPSRYKYNHHLYLKHFPKMVESWNFSSFDTVLSTSSAFTHGIITNGKPRHICYVHSPARYLWDRTHDVIEHSSHGILGSLKKHYLHSTFHKLRIWDAEIAARPDVLLAASEEVQRRIELYWRRESQVVYPPIDDFWFSETFGGTEKESLHYFLIVSSLVQYKRIDLAIEACNNLGLHLKIVGEGPDRKRLEKIAGNTIEFYGYRNGDELGDLYTDATAVLFPGEEDFGLVPLEAMACGTPVIAHRSGGALETIIEHKTGEFFDDANADSLQTALKNYDQKKYSKEECKQRASEFSMKKFTDEITKIIAP